MDDAAIRRDDSSMMFPTERLNGFTDALLPIIATVLFAKNFIELDELDEESIAEACGDHSAGCDLDGGDGSNEGPG